MQTGPNATPPSPSPEKHISWLFLLILLALLVLFPWLPCLVDGQTLFLGDTFYYFLPLRFTLHSAFQQGVLPTWDPSLLSGNPFCADPQANCYYPGSIFYFLSDFFFAYHAALVAHLIFGATGCFVWLLARGHFPLSALLASLTFAGAGLTISSVNRLDKFESLCWWPWAVLGLEMILRRALTIRSSASETRPLPSAGITVLALSMAGEILAGGLEIAMMSAVFLAIWALMANGQVHPLELLPRDLILRIKKLFGPIFLSAVLCLLLTAPQWCSFAELLRYSTRAEGLSYEKAIELSLFPGDLWGLLFPYLFFSPLDFLFYPLPGQASEARYHFSLYLGWLPAFAATSAVATGLLRKNHTKTVIVCLLLIALSLFFALGAHNPLYRSLFAWCTPLQRIRYPEKFIDLALFSLIPLVAIGADYWANSWQKFQTAGAVLLISCVVWWMFPGAFDALLMLPLQLTLGGTADNWMQHLRSLHVDLFSRALLAGVGLLAIGTLYRRTPESSKTIAVLLGLVVALDLWTGTRGLNPTLPVNLLETPPPLANLFRQKSPNDLPERLHILPIYHEKTLRYPSGLSSEQSYVWLHHLLYPNVGLLHDLYYGDGSRAIRLDHQARYFSMLRQLPIELQLDLLRKLSVHGLVSKRDASSVLLAELPGVEKIGHDSKADLFAWRLRYAFPAAWFVKEALPMPSNDAVRSAVIRGDYDLARAVGLVQESSVPPTPASSDGRSDAPPKALPIVSEAGGKIMRIGPIDAPQSGYVVLGTTWYPGWSAAVDGQKTPVLFANAWQLAVAVPAGQHNVRFAYHPTFSRPRWLLFGFGMIGIGVQLISCRRKGARVPDDAG